MAFTAGDRVAGLTMTGGYASQVITPLAALVGIAVADRLAPRRSPAADDGH